MNATTVDFCSIADPGYFVPLTVMLTSAKLSKRPETNYRVHVLHTGLGDFAMRKLQELDSDDFKLIFYPIQLEQLGSVAAKSHVPNTALAKFCLPNLLPQLDRVLYMDGDIIVRKDLSSLFSVDMGNNYIASVLDMSGKINMGMAELTHVSQYINSGVVLMNLPLLREHGMPDKMIKLKMEAPPEWPCMDQDVINVTCQHNTLILPVRYNCMSTMWLDEFATPLATVNDFYGENYTSWEELQDDAVIIHYAGRPKPWKHLLCSYRDLWMRCYAASPIGNMGLSIRMLTPPSPAKKQKWYHVFTRRKK